MSDFIILTDSSADLSAEMAQELDVQVIPLSFIMKGRTYRDFPDNREMDPHLFYEALRQGRRPPRPLSTWASTPRRWSPCSRPGRTC